ncbi:MAG: hypothetical protein LBV31_00640 [Prevotellaceae bacterium]|nr:hypothetical protein [Prevotellaceae bacterium]
MRKIFTSIIFMCAVLPLSAQSGYMGKRLLINADMRVTPAWWRPNADGDKGYTKFNYFLEPGLEFILTNSSSVGVTYLNTQGMFPVWAGGGSVSINHGSYNSEHYFHIGQIDNNTFNSNGIGVFYKQYYGSHSAAPFGYYVKGELDYFSYNYTVNAIDVKGYLDNPIAGYSNILYDRTTGKGSNFGVKIEFGRDFLLFNRIRLSTGMSFGVTTKGWSLFALKTDKMDIFNDEDGLPYIFNFEEPNKKTTPPTDFVNGQLLTMYWFGLKMGIGFLAF